MIISLDTGLLSKESKKKEKSSQLGENDKISNNPIPVLDAANPNGPINDIKFEEQEINLMPLITQSKLNSSINLINHCIEPSYIPEAQIDEFQQIYTKFEPKSLEDLRTKIDRVTIEWGECDNIETFDTIGYIKSLKSIIKDKDKISKLLIKKLKQLKSLCFKWRKIKGDGNCYYRAVIFSYIENIILKNKVDRLRDIICSIDINFEEDKLKEKLYMNQIYKEHILLCMLLLYNLITKESIDQNERIIKAYETLLKFFNRIDEFDFGLIIYFRFLVYKFIKINEKKYYTQDFPISLGNLLPIEYETDDGTFLFNKFYDEFLLKLHKDAEKIIIYITPYVLDINFNILMWEKENSTLRRMKFNLHFPNDDNDLNEITILYSNEHYDLIYNENFVKKYSIFLDIYQENNNVFRDKSHNMELQNRNEEDLDEEQFEHQREEDINRENNFKILNNKEEVNLNENYGKLNVNRNDLNEDDDLGLNEFNEYDMQNRLAISNPKKPYYKNNNYRFIESMNQLNDNIFKGNQIQIRNNTEQTIPLKSITSINENTNSNPRVSSTNYEMNIANTEVDSRYDMNILKKIELTGKNNNSNVRTNSIKQNQRYINLRKEFNLKMLKCIKLPTKRTKINTKKLVIKAKITKNNLDAETVRNSVINSRKNPQISFKRNLIDKINYPTPFNNFIQKNINDTISSTPSSKYNTEFSFLHIDQLNQKHKPQQKCEKCSKEFNIEHSDLNLCNNCLLKEIKDNIRNLFIEFISQKNKNLNITFLSLLRNKEIQISNKNIEIESAVLLYNKYSSTPSKADPSTIIKNIFSNICHYCYFDIDMKKRKIVLPCSCVFCGEEDLWKFLLKKTFKIPSIGNTGRKELNEFNYICLCNKVYSTKETFELFKLIKDNRKGNNDNENMFIKEIDKFIQIKKNYCCMICFRDLKDDNTKVFECVLGSKYANFKHLMCEKCYRNNIMEGKKIRIKCELCDKEEIIVKIIKNEKTMENCVIF